jgi:hypothetical protein
MMCRCCPREPELFTNHGCIVHIPPVITNCSPLIVVEDFYSSVARRSANKTEGALSKCCRIILIKIVDYNVTQKVSIKAKVEELYVNNF